MFITKKTHDAAMKAELERSGRISGKLLLKTERVRQLEATLDTIIAMETPSCASIGKRMAAAARDGSAAVVAGRS